MIYKVTIEAIPEEDDGDVPIIPLCVGQDVDLGWALAYALRSSLHQRPCGVVGELCKAIWEGNGESYEAWDGYNEAINRLLAAGIDLVDGWEKHDEELTSRAIAIQASEPPS